MKLEQIIIFFRDTTFKTIAAVIIIVVALAVLYYLDQKGESLHLNYEFSGKISNKYIVKVCPYIEINKSKYGFSGYDSDFFEKNLQIGDSLVKKKGDFKVEVYRKDSIGQYQFIGNWTNY
jgi:hypothetical protein